MVPDAELDPARARRRARPRCSPTRPASRRWATPRARSAGPTPPRASPTSSRRSAGAALSRRRDLELDLTAPRSVHIVGVGGAGMSAIATVLARMGHRVSGSDLRESRALERLAAARRRRRTSATTPTNVPADADAVVDLHRDPRAQRRGRRRRASAASRCCAAPTRCARSSRRARTIAVAGSHGKTTTSSMLALILRAAGWHPSFLIGGELNEVGTNAVFDAGEWLVVEADESDGTFLELGARGRDRHQRRARPPRPLRRLRRARRRVRALRRPRCPASCVAVRRRRRRRRASPPAATGARRHLRVRRRRRLPDATTTRAGAAARSSRSRARGEPLGVVELPVPGRHNATNAAGAAAIALELGVPFDAVARALGGFGGVARRFQFRGERDGVTFVDDYAHLPSEVDAMIARRARRRLGARGRRCSSRTATRGPRRCGATSPTRSPAPTRVVLTDVYPAGEQPQPGRVRPARAPRGARRPPRRSRSPTCRAAPTSSRTCPRLARPGDVVLTLGAGDLTTVPDEWLAPTSMTVGTRRGSIAAELAARLARPGSRSSATCPSPTLTTYRVGGPVAVLVRVESRRRSSPRVAAALADARRRRCSSSAAARTCSSPTPGSPGSRLVLGGEFERRRPRRRTPRRRRGPAARCRSRCSPGARAGGRSQRPRVLRRHPRQRRRRGADERGWPRPRDRRRARRAPRSSTSPAAAPRRAAPPADARASGTARSALAPAEVVIGADVPRSRAGDRGRVRGRRSPRSCAGGASTSPAARTPARCSRNPPGDSAGRLIDALGLKGLRVGGAVVSAKHANFFQAEPGATADDVHALVRRGAAAGARRDRRSRSSPSCGWSASTTTSPGRRGTREHPRRARPTRPARSTPRVRGAGSRPGAPSGRRRLPASLVVVCRRRRGAGGAGVGRVGVAAARRRPRRASRASTRLTAAEVAAAPAGSTAATRCVWLDTGRGRARRRGAAVRPRARRSSASGPDTVRITVHERTAGGVGRRAGAASARGRRHRAGARDGRRRAPAGLPAAARREAACRRSGGTIAPVDGAARRRRAHRARRRRDRVGRRSTDHGVRARTSRPDRRSGSGQPTEVAAKVRAALAVLERARRRRRCTTST